MDMGFVLRFVVYDWTFLVPLMLDIGQVKFWELRIRDGNSSID